MAQKQDTMMDVWEVTQGMHKILTNHVRLLLEQYKTMKGLYGGNKALVDAAKDFWPKGTEKFFAMFDVWLENQLETFERSVDDSVKDYAESISALEFQSPNTNHFQMLVGEHTRLWIDNYQKLRERREQTSLEAVDAMKKLLPAMIHPVIDNTNRWMQEQNQRIERELLERIKKFNIQVEKRE